MKRGNARPGRDVVREPALDIPVMGAFDVVVAGAGIAGVAAAVAAARNGSSVCLIEKACALGGLATLGNVTAWLPLCDGRGRQVTGGLAEELLKLSVRDLAHDNPPAGFSGIPACWRSGGDDAERKRIRYRVNFNPASYLLALEELVLCSGVVLLYDTRVCAVRRDRGLVTHLVVENKSGRSAVGCETVVDATGDADICFLADEETESLDTNVLSGWFTYLAGDGLHLDTLSKKYDPRAGRQNAEGPFFRGDDAEQVTAQLTQTRELIRKRLEILRDNSPDVDIQPVCLPTLPCFRMTRRLVTTFSLAEDHVHRWFDDCVALVGDWRKGGPVYAVPLRACRGVRNRNLLAAGRCMSSDRTAWDVTRAIPVCAATGEAAGLAAAEAARETDGDVHALSVSVLQSRLKAQGVLLDPRLVEPAE